MKGGDNPRAWMKSNDKPQWHHVRHEADMFFTDIMETLEDPPQTQAVSGRYFLLHYGQMAFPWVVSHPKEEREKHAMRNFIETIPLEYRKMIGRFHDRQWHMLNLLARCPGADDLCDSNPALAYALASNWAFHKPAVRQPYRAARSLVWRKQRYILDWLGFDNTEQVCMIFRKLNLGCISMENLFRMRNILQDRALRKILSHAPEVNDRLITCLHRLPYDPWMTLDLAWVAANDPWPDMFMSMEDVLGDIRKMLSSLGEEDTHIKYRSYQDIRDHHNSLTKRVNVLRLTKRGAFPKPPFPGTESIVPILNPHDLLAEGQEQSNCVVSYANAIYNQSVYIYRVFKPVRATLSIKPNGPKKWRIGQLLQAHNEGVSDEHRILIINELNQSSCKKLSLSDGHAPLEDLSEIDDFPF